MEVDTRPPKLNKRRRRLYKVLEYKGDALARFIAVLIFNDVGKILELCSNRVLGEAGRRLGLEEVVSDFEYRGVVKESKTMANAYEVKLWEVFETEGLEEAIDFFKETALKVLMEG